MFLLAKLKIIFRCFCISLEDLGEIFHSRVRWNEPAVQELAGLFVREDRVYQCLGSGSLMDC